MLKSNISLIKKIYLKNYYVDKGQLVIGLFTRFKKLVSSYKCCTFQRMEVYMLTIYFIHGKCVEIMWSHHLWLKVQCNFTYATNGCFNCKVDYNYFLVTNYRRCKLVFFFTNDLIMYENQKFPLDQFCCQLICVDSHFKNI